ncbi:hypothetical protein [Flavitalea sp.]|nr:hypothetical protein [Flavitalea sp.]
MPSSESTTNELVLSSQLWFLDQFKQFQAHIQTLDKTIQAFGNPPKDPLLSELDIAKELGVGIKTIKNRLTKDRVMAYAEINGKRYVRQSELEKYVNHYMITAKR